MTDRKPAPELTDYPGTLGKTRILKFPTEDAWARCHVGHRMINWHLMAETPLETILPVCYRASDRAVRQYAAAWFERGKLRDCAERLSGLYPISDHETSETAMRELQCAVSAANAAIASSSFLPGTLCDIAHAITQSNAAINLWQWFGDDLYGPFIAYCLEPWWEEGLLCANDCRAMLPVPQIQGVSL